ARLGASDIRIVATSAVREASNGRAFAAAVEAATGRRVDVVSGEVEARLTLRGVRHGLGALSGPVLTFDIGGGSTEYVLSEGDTVRSMISLRLGVVPLAERFPFPGVVERARYRELHDEVRRRLDGELPDAICAARVAHLVGTAGTVTTLAALDLGLVRYDPDRVQGHVLSRAAVERLLDRLCRLTVGERAALPCLEPRRAHYSRHGDRDGDSGPARGRRASSQRVRTARGRSRGRDRGPPRISAGRSSLGSRRIGGSAMRWTACRRRGGSSGASSRARRSRTRSGSPRG